MFARQWQDGEERRKLSFPSVVTVNQTLLESGSLSTAFDSLPGEGEEMHTGGQERTLVSGV